VLVLYSSRVLGFGEAGFGVLLAAGAVGSVLGGLVGPRLLRGVGPAVAAATAIGLLGLTQGLLGLTSEPVLAIILFVGNSLGFGMWNVVSVSVRQLAAPPHLLGRVNGAYRFLFFGATAAGAAVGGVLAGAFGVRAPFLLGAPVVLAAGAIALVTLRDAPRES
jgi:predicted MFS family arabinose efflux permease